MYADKNKIWVKHNYHGFDVARPKLHNCDTWCLCFKIIIEWWKQQNYTLTSLKCQHTHYFLSGCKLATPYMCVCVCVCVSTYI